MDVRIGTAIAVAGRLVLGSAIGKRCKGAIRFGILAEMRQAEDCLSRRGAEGIFLQGMKDER